MKFTVELPLPPSANASYANVPDIGRVKTKAYKDWRHGATWAIAVQARTTIHNRISVSIEIPETCALDVDNVIKPILDALVGSGRIDDDKHVMRVSASKVTQGDKAIVTVKEWGA